MLTRLAPTPSGYIHTGNIYNFLLNWLWARSNNGKVMLRIDDGDATRKRKEYVEDIFYVLDWLGLDWDIGPSGPGDFEANWSQLKRTDLYKDILDELVKKNCVFACTCSRNQACQCAEKKTNLHQTNTAWKMKVIENSSIHFRDKILGDTAIDILPFVIKRKDGFASYQVCSLADDRHFGITHICRGNDLKESTAMQLYIDQQTALPSFYQCQFWHHLLIPGTNGIKLSKSAGVSAESIIKTYSKADIFSSFSSWMGWQHAGGITLQEMMQAPVFNMGK